MAIGDTVQAGLMRVDFSPIQRAGEAQARANQAFGQTIGNVLDKFYEKKREKAQQESIADTLVSTFGVNRDEANHLSKNKEFIPTFFEQQKAQRDYELQLDQFNQASQLRDLQMDQIQQSMEGQKADRLRAEQARQKEEAQAQIYDQFLGTREMVDMPIGVQDQNPLMRGVEQPTAQVPQGDYMGNRFMQTEQGRNMLTDMFDSGIDRSDALATAGKFEAQLLENQPKSMTPEEKASYEKLLLENEGLKIKNLQAEDKLDKTLNPPIGDESYTGSVLEAIDEIYDIMDNGPQAKGPVSGFGAETFMNVGGSNAANAAALIKTIMSDVAFSRLQKMRNDSPTGGALGQVSNIELDLLKSAMGSLDQKISPPLFRKNLDSLKKHYDNFMRSIQARNLAAQQGLTFKTTEEAISWMDKNVPMGGKPAPDNQTNIITKGGFVLTAPGN